MRLILNLSKRSPPPMYVLAVMLCFQGRVESICNRPAYYRHGIEFTTVPKMGWRFQPAQNKLQNLSSLPHLFRMSFANRFRVPHAFLCKTYVKYLSSGGEKSVPPPAVLLVPVDNTARPPTSHPTSCVRISTQMRKKSAVETPRC